MVAILMVSGTEFAMLASGMFCIGGRYRWAERGASLVERVCTEWEAEERLLESSVLHRREPEWRSASEALQGPELHEFWNDFARASWLVGEDPVSTAAELRLLRTGVRECLRMVGEVLEVSDEGLVTGGGERHG